MGQPAILADMNNFPIDAVITWVDGNDPVHKAKRKSYISCAEEDKSDDIGGETRFMSSGEIVCCVGSILRYAPFVRRIFIVTDSQRPRLKNFIASNFPSPQTTVEIVDHREIFRGYEDFLPTFNSLSIETMLYRIPGLSEHYVYFNDDVFISRVFHARFNHCIGHFFYQIFTDIATEFIPTVPSHWRSLS